MACTHGQVCAFTGADHRSSVHPAGIACAPRWHRALGNCTLKACYTLPSLHSLTFFSLTSSRPAWEPSPAQRAPTQSGSCTGKGCKPGAAAVRSAGGGARTAACMTARHPNVCFGSAYGSRAPSHLATTDLHGRHLPCLTLPLVQALVSAGCMHVLPAARPRTWPRGPSPGAAGCPARTAAT